LRLVTESAGVLTPAPAVKALLGSLSSDLLLEDHGEARCWRLSALLQPGHCAAHRPRWRPPGVVPIDVALGLVLGADLGSGAAGAC